MLEGKKLIFTAYSTHSVFIFKSDGEKLIFESSCRIGTRPMGMDISPSGEELAVGVTGFILFFRKRHDGSFRLKYRVPTGSINIHQLKYLNNDIIVYNNTMKSTIDRIVHNTSEPKVVYRPSWITDSKGLDKCHLNGLAVKDGKLIGATSFCRGDVPRAWKRSETGSDEGVIVCLEEGEEVLVEGLNLPHTPVFHEGAWWYCDSGQGTVVRKQGDTTEVVSSHSKFTRGLAFDGHYMAVGLSGRRNRPHAELDVWGKQEEDDIGVAVVDLNTHQVVARTEPLSEIKDIFDVLIVPDSFRIAS